MTRHRYGVFLRRTAAAAALLLACLAPSVAPAQQRVGILSANFLDVFLRLDGNGVTHFLPSGGGTANGQFGMLPWEHFILHVISISPTIVTLESAAFPGVFLRLDGNGVTHFMGPGGGRVNGQFGAFAWERFRIVHQATPAGSVAFESVAFPGVFLRLDGNGVNHFMGPGGGTANAQFGVGPWEKFYLVVDAP
jgi:phospholipase C